MRGMMKVMRDYVPWRAMSATKAIQMVVAFRRGAGSSNYPVFTLLEVIYFLQRERLHLIIQ